MENIVMRRCIKIIFLMFLSFISMLCSVRKEHINCTAKELRNDTLLPTVLIAILARNKAHTLPYFFGYIEEIDYPRDRISLWIRSDHNIDYTIEILKTWLDANKGQYHSVDVLLDDTTQTFADGPGVFEWSPSHFAHIIHLKESALKAARRIWADYIMFLDSDVFLVNKKTLKLLVEEEKTVIAPVIETLGAYSNFWCGMTEQGYYRRTEDYLPILEREKIGTFEVPMVHSAVLVDLRHKKSLNLTFDPKKIAGYSGPVDDIIAFAFSAKSSGVKMFVTNKEPFGYMLAPLEKENSLQDDRDQLLNLKVEIMVDEPKVYVSKHLEHFLPTRTRNTLGFDQVYLINLDRRPERKERMLNTLSEMGIDTHIFSAVDGQALNDTYIKQLGIKMLPEYADPYHKRPLTRGEIGCFLSHYHLWRDSKGFTRTRWSIGHTIFDLVKIHLFHDASNFIAMEDVVKRYQPKFITLLCQEVGGKNTKESMGHVEEFLRSLMTSEELSSFGQLSLFLDEDIRCPEKYIVHNIISYFCHKYVPLTGKEVYTGSIEHVGTK